MSMIPGLYGGWRTNVVDPLEGSNIEWKETADAHVFKADVPGLKKEELKVEIEGDRVLLVSGERSSGMFMRRFRLPENAKVDEVKAAMENGVLTVSVPKIEMKKRSIQISG